MNNSFYFNHLKNEFYEKYLKNEKNFKISYEELYFRNGINRLLEYINLEGLKNTNFPYGFKYRIEKLI